MNYLDYLIFTANTPNVRRNFPPLLSDYIADPVFVAGVPQSQGHPGSDENPPVFPAILPLLTTFQESYPRAVYDNFIFYQDTSIIDKAIQKHWYDMVSGPISPISGSPIFNPNDAPPYHIIYAYLLENTKMYEIFEKVIFLYLNDEELGVASSDNIDHQKAFQWILNTENLFFKHLSNNNFRNITSSIRVNEENVRRNAYNRLFGMDLAFEHSKNNPYHKSKIANSDFILLFEQFLREVWQAYINARNSSGTNSTDYQKLVDMVTKLRGILLARRGVTGTLSLSNYRFMNLSREEYSSVGLFNWLFYIISYDSPLVTFLGCQANTSSERLRKIGMRVQIEPHSKSQALMDLSVPTATILRMIEFGTFELTFWLQDCIESQTLGSTATPQQATALLDLLTIINNWEKSTGHSIKNSEVNIRGNVTLQQSGTRILTNGTMPKPAMN